MISFCLAAPAPLLVRDFPMPSAAEFHFSSPFRAAYFFFFLMSDAWCRRERYAMRLLFRRSARSAGAYAAFGVLPPSI